MQWTRTNLLEREESADPVFQYAGTHGNYDITNCIGTPKDKVNFATTWEMPKFNVSAIVNYMGSMDNVAFEDHACAEQFPDGSDVPGGCGIPWLYTTDLSGRRKRTDSLEIFASVLNAIDKIAPLDLFTYGAVNYNPMHSSGAIGRSFTLGAKYTFN